MCDSSKPLLEDLVVQSHVCINLVKKVGVKLELKLVVFLYLLVLDLIGVVAVYHSIVSRVDDVTLCKFLLVLIRLDTLGQEYTITIFGESLLFICFEILQQLTFQLNWVLNALFAFELLHALSIALHALPYVTFDFFIVCIDILFVICADFKLARLMVSLADRTRGFLLQQKLHLLVL